MIAEAFLKGKRVILIGYDNCAITSKACQVMRYLLVFGATIVNKLEDESPLETDEHHHHHHQHQQHHHRNQHHRNSSINNNNNVIVIVAEDYDYKLAVDFPHFLTAKKNLSIMFFRGLTYIDNCIWSRKWLSPLEFDFSTCSLIYPAQGGIGLILDVDYMLENLENFRLLLLIFRLLSANGFCSRISMTVEDMAILQSLAKEAKNDNNNNNNNNNNKRKIDDEIEPITPPSSSSSSSSNNTNSNSNSNSNSNVRAQAAEAGLAIIETIFRSKFKIVSDKEESKTISISISNDDNDNDDDDDDKDDDDGNSDNNNSNNPKMIKLLRTVAKIQYLEMDRTRHIALVTNNSELQRLACAQMHVLALNLYELKEYVQDYISQITTGR